MKQHPATSCNHVGNQKQESNKSQITVVAQLPCQDGESFLTGGIHFIHFSPSGVFILRDLRWNCGQTINHLAWCSARPCGATKMLVICGWCLCPKKTRRIYKNMKITWDGFLTIITLHLCIAANLKSKKGTSRAIPEPQQLFGSQCYPERW